ncbi:hypothetical protein VX037_22890 [Gordonia sp. Z-3]|jgi:hypothetical protein|uniref:Uncharacterized protein n=1 Tax=Gordonia tangerina TaxID=2911060 RepID=A0ABS9DH53_9ACTN|nr:MULTISPECIES: hypothetical protein [Gordonia]MCF3938540.1 hypothetical protein [Gordonia tangerina]MED5803877.1 hypothetical protein [Gordonia sp. Z-3]
MNRTARLAASALAASGLAVGATTVAAASATAAEPAALSIQGDLALTPDLHLLRIDAEGARTGAGATGGTYTATVLAGTDPTPIQVTGPITCIYVKGDTASLVYPISDIKPIGLPAQFKDAAAVQITVREGTDGRSDMVGVNGPMLTSSFTGCAPTDTPFAFDGEIETSGG